MLNIKIKKYPALNEILWDYHCKTITGIDALKIYESRWRYVEQNKLIDKEKNLITTLANKYGNGFFFTLLWLILPYVSNRTPQ